MQDQSVINSQFNELSKYRSFLSDCINQAIDEGQSLIASIALPFNYLAPLAILQSLDLDNQLHFYSERSADDTSLLAFGSVRLATFSGKKRFDLARDFSDTLKSQIKVYNSSRGHKLERPHFFSTFTFEDELDDLDEFAPATIFLPHWHVFSDSGQYGIVLNLEVVPSATIDTIIASLEQAFEYFLNMDYGQGKTQEDRTLLEEKSFSLEERLSVSSFEEAVKTALFEIENDHYRKIVLAEKRIFENKSGLSGIDILDRLKEQFSACHLFSFSDGSDKVFVGASPEILLDVKSSILTTQAIAGSSSRGKKAVEDAKLGSSLLTSDKNLREHNLVKESLLRRLGRLGIKAQADAQPRLLVLSNVQHLQTKIKAHIDCSAHFLEMASELFPTPAVGGQPREKAVPRINALEGFNRGLYSGLLGWFSDLGEGKMVVGIRSAQFSKDLIQIYAGAGIVAGSKPLVEQKEILLKQEALLGILR